MKLLLLVALLGVAYVAAECPEACNGHGFCGEYDKCSCYRNWQGNSCADRTCPFDIAFVDIPHGDLNMDGKLDDEITTYGAQINDVYAFEVYPTDGYQIERHAGRCNAASANEGDACLTDADCPDGSGTGACTNTALDSSEDDIMYTDHTLREKAASFYDQVEDGHFYAECSNKGMCDRKSGQCDCFDGYSGTACRRVACPNDCSGHGTCETMQETAEANGFSYQLWDRYKSQVCSCDPGYFGIDCAQRHCPYGDDPLSTDEHDEIQWLTLRTHGTGLNGPVAASTASAETDFSLSGTFRLAYKDEYGETWNTSPIKAQNYDTSGNTANDKLAAAIKDALEGIPNSVFESVTVEVWPIQTPIGGSFTCATGSCALNKVAAHGTDDGGTAPESVWVTTKEQNAGCNLGAVCGAGDNEVCVTQATCEAETGGVWRGNGGVDTGGLSVADGLYTADDNGAKKFGVSNCARAGTNPNPNGDGTVTGEFATKVALNGQTLDANTNKVGAGITDTVTDGSTGLCRYDMNGFRAKITFTSNPGDLNELTCDADLVTTPEHVDSNAPATDIVCTAQDRNTFELGAIGQVEGSTIGGGNGGQLATNMDLSNMVGHGDRIIIGSEVFTIAGPVNPPTKTAVGLIIVEEETSADVDIASGNAFAPAAAWYGKGTKERTECSHRGLCNHDEGLCECFTGYTHDDCSMQDALNA